MCGIVLAVGGPELREALQRAHRRQFHRGPDAQKIAEYDVSGRYVGLGHQRLAIVDLSDHGIQPMESLSERLSMTFNGEIYNWVELAQKYGLTGEASRNDTRVAIELIERLGIAEACKQFNGMWALAVLDKKEGAIHLSRDRLGKKPLYFAESGGNFMAASEMHSLLLMPGMDFAPDLVTASRFLSLSLQNVDERSWADGITSIAPGTVRTLKVTATSSDLGPEQAFWPQGGGLLDGAPTDRSVDEWAATLRSTLEDAVAMRLRADVPVGIALSGGIDSSVICSIAAQKTEGQAATIFSAVSPGEPEDEGGFVDIVANHLSIPVQKVELSAQDSANILNEVSECAHFHDGPLTSFSPLLFRRLMSRAREMGITVVLTGQGADEAFCGYRKYPYFALKQLLNERRIPATVALGAQLLSKGAIGNFSMREAKRYMGRSERDHLGDAIKDIGVSMQGGATVKERQWADMRHYSVPALCHYEDRMSMSVAREVRSPFLDYRIVEMGLAMPLEAKLGKGWTKYVLRKAFEHDLPKEIIWRRDKKGFANPEDRWLRGAKKQALEIMTDRNAPVYRYGLVDQDAYLGLLGRYFDGDSTIWFREVFAPLSTNIWLLRLEAEMAETKANMAA